MLGLGLEPVAITESSLCLFFPRRSTWVFRVSGSGLLSGVFPLLPDRLTAASASPPTCRKNHHRVMVGLA